MVNVSTGSIRYVFTQSAAPSGQGEVSGSLWYDVDIDKLFTYTGAAWVAVGADAPLHATAQLGAAGATSTSSTSFVDVAGLTVNIVTTVTCTIVGTVWFAGYMSANAEVQLKCVIDGTDTGITLSGDAATDQEPLLVTGIKTGVTSGTKVIKAQYKVGSSTMNVHAAGSGITGLAFAE